MEAIIVGVDPGTTAAVAICRLDGTVRAVHSKKEWGVDAMIAFIQRFGTPIAVGTDKAKVPATVERIATSFGARCVVPKKDLSVKEKVRAAKEECKNDHERDAVAAARVCLQEVQPRVQRVEQFVKKKGAYAEEKVLLKEMMKSPVSLHDALLALRQVKKQKETIVLPTKPSVEKLQQRLKILDRQNVLQQQVIGMLQKRLRPSSHRKEKQQVKEKTRVLQKVRKELARTTMRLTRLKQQQSRLVRMIVQSDVVWLPVVRGASNAEVVYVVRPTERVVEKLTNSVVLSHDACKGVIQLEKGVGRRLGEVFCLRDRELESALGKRSIEQLVLAYRSERRSDLGKSL